MRSSQTGCRMMMRSSESGHQWSGDKKGGGLPVASFLPTKGVVAFGPTTGKPVLAATSGVGNSDLVGHPSRPSLASHSRPYSLARECRDFRPRACNRLGRAHKTDRRDGRGCAVPKRALPVRKLREQRHLKARFLTFVCPSGVPRVRVQDWSQGFGRTKGRRPIRKANSRSDLDSRNSVNWL